MKNGLTYGAMVRAMKRDDARYDGKFFVCVTSTGIFCLPSCKARLPRPDHVVFVRTREEALRRGYRGCLRCRAGTYPDTHPVWWPGLLHLLEADRGRISEREMSARTGVDITTIRRYFRKTLKATPTSFHRRLRLRHARRLLEEGSNYLTAAYECGYESPSGFRDAFRKEYGIAPGMAAKGG